ncbi:hypothetical protein [Smaragdicoccus niigatensis]|uniref:hypothetical protein n=1 Tax=Smaragdicoccus niigatensis TaxID=359359 RepID=UPI001FDF264A|nr:hypothetical protein [Smaragdicoccus niigatensis]
MRLLAGDLLPDDVLARTSKAAFGESRFGEGVRQFAENWSGHGLNTDDVDVEVLRETWLQGECSPQSVMLLHAAWLNDNVNN